MQKMSAGKSHGVLPSSLQGYPNCCPSKRGPADIDVAPRAHVEKGIQGERRQIANDRFALAMKVDHYNATHPDEEPLQMVFNFEEDIEEMKIAKGLDDEAA
jgi:hypothetical protein